MSVPGAPPELATAALVAVQLFSMNDRYAPPPTQNMELTLYVPVRRIRSLSFLALSLAFLQDMGVIVKKETAAESVERKAKRARRRQKRAKLHHASSSPPPVPVKALMADEPPPPVPNEVVVL